MPRTTAPDGAGAGAPRNDGAGHLRWAIQGAGPDRGPRSRKMRSSAPGGGVLLVRRPGGAPDDRRGRPGAGAGTGPGARTRGGGQPGRLQAQARVLRGQGRGSVPARLGNEFAGVVDQVGEGVGDALLGSEVLGFTAGEAYAQYVVVGADQVTAKPAGLPFEVAGGLSAVGQTAFNAMRELGIRSGETLLVHAAAGGVGTVATQLAHQLGAAVIGTASERNHDYLRSLGAQPVVYGDGLVDRVRELAPSGVDAVLDAIGDDGAIEASLALAKDRGRIGTIAREDAPELYGIRRLRGVRSAAILAELAERAAAGSLVLPVWRTFPLADAAAAHREVETGHVRGKVVLTVE
jgi:enoyl reductase